MTDNNQPDDDSRRTFLKGAAATGLAATGLGVFGGSAAAQQNVRNLSLGDVTASDGLLTIDVRNINVLNNINFDDIFVTVIGGGVQILEGGVNVDVNFEEEVIEVSNVDVDVLNNALNNNNVQVGVTVLGGTNVLAAGDTIA